jgi:hypothetical protein
MIKMYLVNCNISEDEELFEFEDVTNYKEIVDTLNLTLDGVKTAIQDPTSIYNGFSLDMVRIEVSENDVKKLIEDSKSIIIAEDSHDIDYSVFISTKSLDD